MCCGHCPRWKGWAAAYLVCSPLPLKSSHHRGCVFIHTHTLTYPQVFLSSSHHLPHYCIVEVTSNISTKPHVYLPRSTLQRLSLLAGTRLSTVCSYQSSFPAHQEKPAGPYFH
ncbi:hypothetical protein CORC01_08075 [Colletotrichum orchidophilum]|uniref:Uncharacterized protein n=1 Tax=Colletotrichum orchidophilum TaxID=1209926 RepID=A0A1G4B5A2_9PEZI|nr:uncharacterized protein CORC01_08075 [Colletotrichum orchidophilum]OHE96618.1 hypothetical protein CORC01_08075 [Colletotrichum orchidophilum]